MKDLIGTLGLIFLSVFLIILFGFSLLFPTPRISYSDIYQSTIVTPTPTPIPTPKPIILNADKLWSLVQNWRKSENLQAYTKDQLTCDIANDRIKDWVIQDDNHAGFIKKYGNKYPFELAENAIRSIRYVDRSYVEQSLLNSWLASPGHSTILHTSYPRSCIACQSNWCVQIFANY